jgi:hypothetical protein
LQNGIKDRHLQLCWVAEYDPIRIRAFEQGPLMEYLLLLDKKISDQLRLLKSNR